MNGILILAHGSREKHTEDTLKAVVEMVKEKVDGIIETAFLQFSEKNLEYGLKSLIEKGVTHIKVVPYFLFEGVHICEDIPKEIEEFLGDYKGVTITMGKTLGNDPRLAEVLVDRINE